MTLREHCTPEQLAAHSFLDDVRAGVDVHHQTVAHALRVLGEPVELIKTQTARPLEKMKGLHKKLKDQSEFRAVRAVALCIKYLKDDAK